MKIRTYNRLAAFIILTFVFIGKSFVIAQTLSVKMGGETGKFDVNSRNEFITFESGEYRHFLTKRFKNAVMEYHLTSFNANGRQFFDDQLDIQSGEFKNSFFIEGVFPVGDKIWVIVENTNKDTKTKTFTARLMNSPGEIAKEETSLFSYTYDKIMNSGNVYKTLSPDGKTLTLVAEQPYDKLSPATFKAYSFDQNMKKINEFTFSLSGEDTKNKNITASVANNGMLYILKRTSKKGENVLDVFQVSPEKPDQISTYNIAVSEPDYIKTYTHAINDQNELIIAGLYYQRRTVSAGEERIKGLFFYTNKGLTENVFKTSDFDSQIENLVSRNLIISSNTIYFTTEQWKEVQEPKQPGSPAFEYNYNYTHKNDYVFGFDLEGNKKFQLQFNKNFTARNRDLEYYSGYYLMNDQLVLIYNDDVKKHIQGSNSISIIPLVVTISGDGRSSTPIVLRNELKLDWSFVLTPSIGLSNGKDKITMVMNNSTERKIVELTIEP